MKEKGPTSNGHHFDRRDQPPVRLDGERVVEELSAAEDGLILPNDGRSTVSERHLVLEDVLDDERYAKSVARIEDQKRSVEDLRGRTKLEPS